MRRTFLVLGLLLGAASPAASSHVVLPYTDAHDFRREPGVLMGGTFSNPDGGPLEYPPDDNGIHVARTGTTARILNVRWINAYGGEGADSSEIFHDFVKDQDFLAPGVPGRLLAWYGDWADVDLDGALDHVPPALHLDGSQECARTVGTGPGLTVGPLGTGISYTCGDANEWSPATARIVSYVTPGRPMDVLVTNSLFDREYGDPDVRYIGPQVGDGRYEAPSSKAPFAFPDGSLLQTVVVESTANPLLNGEEGRTHVRDPAQPYDTDVYAALDSATESLFLAFHREAEARGCDMDRLESNLPVAPGEHGRVREPCIVDGQSETYVLDATVGPVFAIHRPPHRMNVGDRAWWWSPAAYFDASIQLAQYVGARVYARDAPAGEWSFTGTGEAQAPFLLGAYAQLGLWHDKNRDGFVGAPPYAPPCPDAHRCGLVQDPNDYAPNEEWSPFCREGGTSGPPGTIPAVLTIEAGAWGNAGAYVLSDRWSLTGGDAYERDGRASFDPWDDVVIDAFDLEVDRLVLSGPIDLHLVCREDGYRSYEHVVMPTSNRERTVRLTVPEFEVRYFVEGVEVKEWLTDEDVLPAWKESVT